MKSWVHLSSYRYWTYVNICPTYAICHVNVCLHHVNICFLTHVDIPGFTHVRHMSDMCSFHDIPVNTKKHVYTSCITCIYIMYTYVLRQPTRHHFTQCRHVLDMAGKINYICSTCFIPTACAMSSHVKFCHIVISSYLHAFHASPPK